MSYYPVFLDIKGKRCVVIGGGTVALRKVSMLLDHGALPEVISPNLCAELDALVADGRVKTIRREYEPGDLEGAFVVVAATNDNRTNEMVAREAKELGILINVVDVPKLSNFIVPSYLRHGDLTVAVSTNGKSPALARKIRRELEKNFGQEYAMLTSLVEEVRSELKERGIVVSGEAWQRALELDPLLDLLRRGRREEAKKSLLDKLT
ncbi:MAG: bifunctional precorrin-2 dehydrogenase/sirohydrochlorin ferrochelatase [Dehalococcoidia bacterium]